MKYFSWGRTICRSTLSVLILLIFSTLAMADLPGSHAYAPAHEAIEMNLTTAMDMLDTASAATISPTAVESWPDAIQLIHNDVMTSLKLKTFDSDSGGVLDAWGDRLNFYDAMASVDDGSGIHLALGVLLNQGSLSGFGEGSPCSLDNAV